MQKTFIIYRNGISGGTATLSLRLGIRLVEHGYKVVYICRNLNDESNYELMVNSHIDVFIWKNKKDLKSIVSKYKESEMIVLTYTLDEYLNIELLLKKICVSSFSTFLYVVSNRGLIKSENYLRFLKFISISLYSKIINKVLEKESIIFMDYYTANKTINFYNIKAAKDTLKVFRLPFKVGKLNIDLIKQKKQQEIFNVLAISRAEFPFKGYLIGLIDEFEKSLRTCQKLYLTIISYGEDLDMLESKIDNSSEKVKSNIHLVGRVQYDELKKFFDNTHLFVGMGTSVLDAVNQGIPAVVVKLNTYTCETNGYFHENAGELGAFSENTLPVSQKIIQSYLFNNDDYLDVINKDYQCLYENYNIDILTDYLLTKKPHKKINVSYVQYVLHSAFARINKLFRYFYGIVNK